jgi:hypothetical protein
MPTNTKTKPTQRFNHCLKRLPVASPTLMRAADRDSSRAPALGGTAPKYVERVGSGRDIQKQAGQHEQPEIMNAEHGSP